MKNLISRILIAVVIASFACASALAKTKSETLTLTNSVKFNGTVIKKGLYKVKFDDQTGELTIADRGGKIVARAATTLEKRDTKAREFMLRFEGAGDQSELISVTFGGADHNLVVGGSAARN